MLGKIFSLGKYSDSDGYLVSLEPCKDIPISIKRSFYISGVKENSTRGNHAAMNASFVFTCIEGSIRVVLTDGKTTERYVLKKGSEALYVKERIWISADSFSDDNAVLLVFSDTSYNDCIYERDYNKYINREEKIDEICDNRC